MKHPRWNLIARTLSDLSDKKSLMLMRALITVFKHHKVSYSVSREEPHRCLKCGGDCVSITEALSRSLKKKKLLEDIESLRKNPKLRTRNVVRRRRV